MARQTLIERLYPEFRAYAHSICSHPDEAEDLLHDAVERALRTDSRPEQPESLRPWMFRVIRNLHYDELRKRRVRREYLVARQRHLVEGGCSADHARDVLIRQAYRKLRPQTREILFLVDIMGLKYAEAAEVMNVPQGTVMSRISRARRAFLELLDGEAGADAKTKEGR